MLPSAIVAIVLGVAAFPFIYYLLALYSSWRFFRRPHAAPSNFTPPVSNLKPVRGLDPDAYENFASFCRQDYPEFEILFCIDEDGDPSLPVIERLIRDFPERRIRILFGSGRDAVNDKVAKLARLASEAQYEVVVISDSDVRVPPDYLRTMTAPLAGPKTGAVTCFYLAAGHATLTDELQTIGMISDFYPGILVARQLDGVKFALGPSIATTRARLAGFGGYEAIENRPGDDLLVGRLIAEQGYEVELLPYAVRTVPDYRSAGDLLQKRLRWIVVMRHMRPWGHLGLIFTLGLPWSLAAVAVHPTYTTAGVYFGAYFMLRAAMTFSIGAWGLKLSGLWRKIPLLVAWDALAVGIWIASFARSSIRWRGADYYIREGQLVPVVPPVSPVAVPGD